MTHRDLVHRAVRWLRSRHKCRAVFAELQLEGEHPDVLGWSGFGNSHLVEVKTSRSDFRRDRHKVRSRRPEGAMGNQRWYFVPHGLLQASDLPTGWGLAEVRNNRVYVLHKAPYRKLGERAERQERRALVSALARHQGGLGYDRETGRYAPYSSLQTPQGLTQLTLLGSRR